MLIFWLLSAGLLLCGPLYVYYVNAAIVNIVDRKQAEAETRDVAANISELEALYYERSSVITPEFAYEQGFIESSHTLFAIRGSYAGLAQLGE